MTAREQILAAAAEHGWSVYRQPDAGWLGEHELRRQRREQGRQRTEYVTFSCDVLDRVTAVTWSPGLDGLHARHPATDKLAWTLRRLRSATGPATEGAPTTTSREDDPR